MSEELGRLEVSRRIGAPADEIFQLLADPRRHVDLDGSEMVPDATIVTERYDCSHAPEDERSSIDNGRIWIEAMTESLERLDALCTGQSSVGDGVENGQC